MRTSLARLWRLGCDLCRHIMQARLHRLGVSVALEEHDCCRQMLLLSRTRGGRLSVARGTIYSRRLGACPH